MELITFEEKDNTLFIIVNGRIDASNAPDVETAITARLAEANAGSVILDAAGLEYISSAGLRVVLRLAKGNKDFKVVNVNSEVYEIFDMTGFSEVINIEKAFRQLSVDGCRIIGRGAKGIVYRYNADTIVKVYKDADSLDAIKNERELARKAFVLGIPTAISYDIVKVGDKYGSVFELLDSKPYSALIADEPEKFNDYIDEFARLAQKIHATPVTGIPDIKDMVNDWNWFGAVRAHLTQDEIAVFDKLLDTIPDRATLLHCDYHTNNVMVQNGEALLIDMDTLSHGHPIFELANLYVTYVTFAEVDPDNVVQFIGFPIELVNRVWDEFLPVYLNSRDEALLKSVTDKTKLLAYCRMVRHLEKRGAENTETVNMYVNRIRELIKTLDTLAF